MPRRSLPLLLILAACYESVVVGTPGAAAPDLGAPGDAGIDAPILFDAGSDGTGDLGPGDLGADLASDPCALAERVVPIAVSFPPLAPDCPWGIGDNLPPAQELATARVEQSFIFEAPDERSDALCSLRFDFRSGGEVAQLRYDDNFFLLMDGVVLAASDRSLVARLPREGDLVLWDWSAIAGVRMNVTDPAPYCLGEEDGIGSCLVPGTDATGAFRLNLPLERFPELSERTGEGITRLTFVTLGDNDPPSDCRHEGVDFELAYTFAAP